MADLLAINTDCPLVGSDYTRKCFDQGAFASTVVTYQGYDFAGKDGKIGPLKPELYHRSFETSGL